MRVELSVRGSNLVVATTIEEGDSVTPGSQTSRDFPLSALQGLPYSTADEDLYYEEDLEEEDSLVGDEEVGGDDSGDDGTGEDDEDNEQES